MYLFDTNVFINIARANKSIEGIVYFFSIITEIELLSYPDIRIDEKNEIEKYCNDLGRIIVDNDIKDEVIYLRSKYRLKTPDAIICGTALAYNLILVTEDKKLLTIDEIKTITFEQLF